MPVLVRALRTVIHRNAFTSRNLKFRQICAKFTKINNNKTMSEPVAAFAVYQNTASKKSNGKSAKKGINNKNNNSKNKLKSNNKNNNNQAKSHKMDAQVVLEKKNKNKRKQANGAAAAAKKKSNTLVPSSAKHVPKAMSADSDDGLPHGQSKSLNTSDEAVYSGEYTMDSSSSYSESDAETTNDGTPDPYATTEKDNDEPCENEKTFSLEEINKRKALKRKQQQQQQKQENKPGSTGGRASTSAKAKTTGSPVSKTRKLSATATSTPNAEGNPTKTKTKSPSGKSSSSHIVRMNSIEEGKRMFGWLLQPIEVEDFFDKYWEKNVCLIKRQQAAYYKHLISFEAIDEMLVNNHVEFTKNIDITSYKNGVRETLNPEGRAMPAAVWDQYGQGCSVRLLNPQTFLPDVYTLSATLQEFFHCLVGANAYLTPPNSQGFAPHYDDIEAFVLQIEGRKRWKLYKPRTPAEQLPRNSSPNFAQEEIGTPILEEVLQPGDILYFPRGTIHQAFTEPGYHSLHITLSVYQKQSYADLFEKMMPLMLEQAIANDVDMRRGLPLHTFQNAGLAFSGVDTQERAEFVLGVTERLKKFVRESRLDDLIDSAVDQVAKKFQHEALPPQIFPSERERTIFGSRSSTNARGECLCDYEITVTTNVRLLRANILRLLQEDGGATRIYYYLDNSMEYCEYEPNYIEIEASEAASVEVLIKSYPAYVSVSQLPLPEDEQKLQVVTALWERGLLMMEKPFK